jgi:hypothetical protein
MERTVASMAIILLGLSLTACAGTKTGSATASLPNSVQLGATQSSPTTTSTLPGSYWKDDGDKDSDDYAHSGKLPDDDDDRNLLAPYPNRPSQAELKAIAATVRGYYTDAAADDGARACGLLDMSLATSLDEGTSQPRQDLNGGCTAAVDHLFREQHQQLITQEPATIVVTSVHVKGDLGLALLGFRKAPEGAILIEREGGVWKLGALFDSEIP